MRKILLGGLGLIAAGSTVLASGAFAGGNGAARSGLTPAVHSGPLDNQCQSSDGTGGNGFVILNAAGKPDAANKLLGEVSLKNATPNTMYNVQVSVGNQNCMDEGTLTTNGEGNGNAHIADPTLGSGTFYVVLTLGTQEAYASGPVTIH